jgi:hypothetical protein
MEADKEISRSNNVFGVLSNIIHEKPCFLEPFDDRSVLHIRAYMLTYLIHNFYVFVFEMVDTLQ